MIIRTGKDGFTHARSSEITPRDTYLQRPDLGRRLDLVSAQRLQAARGSGGDLGEAIFKGRVRIPAAAKHSASNTRCRGLMVGRRARLQAMPTNEVASDKCDCTHGVAVSYVCYIVLCYITCVFGSVVWYCAVKCCIRSFDAY